MIIEISGKITFSRTYKILPIPVELPLVTHARTFGCGTRTVVGLCLTLPFLAMWMLIVWYSGELISVSSLNSLLIFLAAISYCLFILLPGTLFEIIDFARSGLTLTLASSGFTDRRGDVGIPWRGVISVRVTYAKFYTGVVLTLREPIPPRFLFDRGARGLRGRRKAETYEVSATNLSERASILSQTMLAMVRLNGGTVER